MTPAEICDDLRHDSELSAAVEHIENCYLTPLEAAGMTLQVAAVRGRLAEALIALQQLAATQS